MRVSALRDARGQQTAGDVHCELVTSFSRLESLAPEWDRLFASAPPAGGMFQSWPWARAFWKVHGGELSLCTLVVFDGSRVIGILPAAVRGRTARLLGAPYADYNGVLCAPDRATDVIRVALTALLNAPHDWTECIFEGVPASSPLANDGAVLPAWLEPHRQVTFEYLCPTTVNDGAVFDRLSRKESLRRHENRLARRGRLSFRHIEDREEILGGHLDRFFDMQIARLAMMGVRSPFLSPDARAMFRALLLELDPARELRFSVLELDGRALAYHFGLQHAGKYVWYLPAFDVEFWDDSPGEVLLKHVLTYAHERQLTEFDFTIGDEGYKNRFANVVRQTCTVHFDRHPRRIQVRARRVVRSARDAVRRSPRLAKYVRRLRAMLIDATRRLRHPAAFVRSAFGPLFRVFGSGHTVVCQPVHRAPGPAHTHQRRLALTDFALLRLQYSWLDEATMETARRRMKQGEALHLVSVGSAPYLFWMGSEARAAESVSSTDGQPATTIEEGPALGVSPRRHLADALAALLCAVERPGAVRIRSPHRRAVERAIGQSGYAIRGAVDRESPRSAALTRWNGRL